MKHLLISFLILCGLSISLGRFSCEGYCSEDLRPTSFAYVFPETLEERKQALQDFMQNFFEKDSVANKKFEIIVNEDKELQFKLLEKCYDGQPLFNYTGIQQLRSSRFYRVLFNAPFNDPNDNTAAFLDQRYGRMLDWFRSHKEKLIMNILLHLGWINYSKLKDFFRALPFNDLYAPVLHFTNREIDLTKYLDSKMYQNLKEIHEDYERQYSNFTSNLFSVLNEQGGSHFLNYSETERRVVKQDYIYARYIADMYIYYNGDEGYLLPHMPFEKETFEKDFQENTAAYGVKQDLFTETFFIFPPKHMKTNSTLFRHWTHHNWFFNIYHGKLVKDHPEECEFITLWAMVSDTFRINYGLAQISRYIPFPSYGICWKPDDEHKALLQLLAMLVNMDDEEALACYRIAEHEQLVKQKKELYQALIDQCPQVKLKRVDFRELGLKEIEQKLFYIHKFNYFHKKEIGYAKKENDTMRIRNLEFLSEIANYRKESLQDMKKSLIDMNWENKTVPVKEIKYEEDEVEAEDEEKEKAFDELDWELQKFKREKDEYNEKHKEDDEEEEDEEESEEETLEKIKSPPYEKQMSKEFDAYQRKLKEEEATKAEEEEDRIREQIKQKKLSRKAAKKVSDEGEEEIDLDEGKEENENEENEEEEEEDGEDGEDEEEDEEDQEEQVEASEGEKQKQDL